MIFKKLFSKTQSETGFNRGASPNKGVGDIEHTAFFQISSAIKNQKDIAAIFEVIGRESARCLKAQRSTVLLVDGAKGSLKTQFTYSLDPVAGKSGLSEEKEVAQKALTEKRSFLLKEPKDFTEVFKSGERERKITSLMTIPFGFQGKMIGTLNLCRMNGKHSFGEKDLQFLSIFANHASIALQNQYLTEEVRKAASFRKNYDQYLDDLMSQLQNLSVEERRRIDEHIGRFVSGLKSERQSVENFKQISVAGTGVIKLVGEMSFDDSSEGVTEKVQIEIEGYSGKAGGDLSRAGIFIPTSNPRELGEQFLLRLYLPEGKPIEVPCKVIFSNKYGKESQNLRRGMGIKFLDLSPEFQRQFEGYLQTYQNQEIPAEPAQSEPPQPTLVQEEELPSDPPEPRAEVKIKFRENG